MLADGGVEIAAAGSQTVAPALQRETRQQPRGANIAQIHDRDVHCTPHAAIEHVPNHARRLHLADANQRNESGMARVGDVHDFHAVLAAADEREMVPQRNARRVFHRLIVRKRANGLSAQIKQPQPVFPGADGRDTVLNGDLPCAADIDIFIRDAAVGRDFADAAARELRAVLNGIKAAAERADVHARAEPPVGGQFEFQHRSFRLRSVYYSFIIYGAKSQSILRAAAGKMLECGSIKWYT